ncbi:uncharacterized protein BcabD6B2_25890 [Babesia caballi]|uniref:Uncharacterized protein n=1 Tax=Babesia caballi TaxID=5871 RepID=A0AAV4LTM4_BABCB|nr:hypothetical protein BcabD6B2_25890 [Babesia caballi]
MRQVQRPQPAAPRSPPLPHSPQACTAHAAVARVPLAATHWKTHLAPHRSLALIRGVQQSPELEPWRRRVQEGVLRAVLEPVQATGARPVGEANCDHGPGSGLRNHPRVQQLKLDRRQLRLDHGAEEGRLRLDLQVEVAHRHGQAARLVRRPVEPPRDVRHRRAPQLLLGSRQRVRLLAVLEAEVLHQQRVEVVVPQGVHQRHREHVQVVVRRPEDGPVQLRSHGLHAQDRRLEHLVLVLQAARAVGVPVGLLHRRHRDRDQVALADVVVSGHVARVRLDVVAISPGDPCAVVRQLG